MARRSRVTELPRYAQVVLFAPEDLQIVRGDPSSRRRFADQLLVQRSPRLAGVLRRLRPRAQAAHRAPEVGEGTRHPRRSALHPRCVGRQARHARIGDHRARLALAADLQGSARARPTQRSRAPTIAPSSSGRSPSAVGIPRRAPAAASAESTTRDDRRICSSEALIARASHRNWSGVSPWSGRTATICFCGCGIFRSRDTPPTGSRGRSP